jgi:Family of unknown function (DUF6455)
MAVESSGTDPGRTREGFAFVSRWHDRIKLTFAGWRERSQLLREFDELRQRGELDRTLSDSGVHRSDVPRLMRAHPRTPQQLAAMMRRLGISRSELPHRPAVAEALRAMEWRCGECTDWRKCLEWLAAREPNETYRAFCPNAETLDRLRCSDAVAPGAASRKPHGVLAELLSDQHLD